MKNSRRTFLYQAATTGLTPFVPSWINRDKKQDDQIALPVNFKGKNKVGFNFLLWTTSVSEKLNPLTERLKEIGYDGVEAAMGTQEAKPYAEFGKFLKSISMEATAVLAVGKDEDPIHEDAAVRAKALEKLKWAVDRANDLNAKTICGPFHSAFAHFRKRPPSDDEYKRSAEVLHKAGEYAAQSGVIFAVEAINRFECYLCNTIGQLNRLVTSADHPNIRPMFDTHHANIEEKNFMQPLQSLKGMLNHVHISENDRGTPGDGHIRWDEIFKGLSEIDYNGWLTVESFSRNDEAFANSINVWREYSKPWDVATGGFKFIQAMQAKYKL